MRGAQRQAQRPVGSSLLEDWPVVAEVRLLERPVVPGARLLERPAAAVGAVGERRVVFIEEDWPLVTGAGAQLLGRLVFSNRAVGKRHPVSGSLED